MPANATPSKDSFTGFSPRTVKFFAELAENNNRPWFESRREVYEAEVMAPARAFVTALGERMRVALPGVIAIPKVNKSIFRINRDTRFSSDPSPYKTNLGLYFWEGTRPKMESPGFYVHVEPPDFMLGAGMYLFPDRMLDRYRKAVVDPRRGAALAKALSALSGRPGFSLGGAHYKRIPAGFDPKHPRAGLLLHNGLFASFEGPIPEEFYSARLVEYCFAKFEPCFPLHRWLVELAG
jgi:uncharacterized protein (TIGR02453 family)